MYLARSQSESAVFEQELIFWNFCRLGFWLLVGIELYPAHEISFLVRDAKAASPAKTTANDNDQQLQQQRDPVRAYNARRPSSQSDEPAEGERGAPLTGPNTKRLKHTGKVKCRYTYCMKWLENAAGGASHALHCKHRGGLNGWYRPLCPH